MSVKIKVSYDHPQELSYIRRKLWRGIQKLSKQPASGKHLRAYIDFELPEADKQDEPKREKALLAIPP